MNEKETVEQLQAKIPIFNGKHQIIRLSMVHFKRLTDVEFIIFWNLPDLTVHCGKETIKYIEERRQRLGLKTGKHSQIM